MKIIITEVCTGKPDGVHEIVYTDGREYDLPEGLAKIFVDEGKAIEKQVEIEVKVEEEKRTGKGKDR